MRVALFVNGFPDARRPHHSVFNERTAVELSKHVDLSVIVPMAMRPGRQRIAVERRDGLDVIRVSAPVVPPMKRLSIHLYQAFVKYSLKPYLESADIVHSVGVGFAGLVVGALSKGYRFCHVTQIINDVRCLKGRRFESYPYVSDLRERLGAVICNSRALEQTARELFPGTRLIRTAYRGTDLARFTPDGPQAQVYGKRPGTRFLFLGGLPSYPDRIYGRNTKGGLTLMDAWRQVEDEMARSGATLFFGGPESESQPARTWRAGLKHAEAVVLGGLVQPLGVPAILRAADVALIPSMEEGCPNFAFEAYASGRAVFGSDIGPLAEIIDDEQNGLLLRAGDASAWKDVLVAFARPDSRSRLEPMGSAARQKAELLFDRRAYAKQLVEIYEQAESRVER